MYFRCIGSSLIAALVVALGAGCRKSESDQTAKPQSSPETIARIHWLGKKGIAADTNSAPFMKLWELPASTNLGAQTLDRLSLAPWRLFKNDAATNGAPLGLLRTILDDLVQNEFYLEIRNAGKQPGELVLAVRLDDDRARVWETNLAAVAESLTGIRPLTATNGGGWSLNQPKQPKSIELSRAGDWTLLNLSSEQPALLHDFQARIGRDHVPFSARGTNFWLEADLDFPRVSHALSLGWNLPDDFPKFFVNIIGEGGVVITSGSLNFPGLPEFNLAPWNFPTNLIHDPVISFTALRGIQSWLASHRIWTNLALGAPPDQLYLWTMDGSPVQTYFVAPLADASNQVRQAAELLVKESSPWLDTNIIGSFKLATNFNGAVWAGVPFMSPFLESRTNQGGGLAYGGLFPNARTNPAPADLIHEVLRHTDLICYDWELTGPRIEGQIYTIQLLRMALHKAQMNPESASFAWWKALIPKLGNCATVFTKTGKNELSFYRRSDLGLSSFEVHLLSDWLESPQFPRGLHTLLVPPPAPVKRTE